MAAQRAKFADIPVFIALRLSGDLRCPIKLENNDLPGNFKPYRMSACNQKTKTKNVLWNEWKQFVLLTGISL